MTQTAEIIGLYIGKAVERWEGKGLTAIQKTLCEGRLEIGENGFVLDEQGDRTVHGGPEKAIHHYAADHLDFWKQEYPDFADQFVPGCFGENISTHGLNEDNLCLGDILSLGTAKVQICQGRQPCWKLTKHTGIKAFAMAFQQTALTGWYYRVLEPGHVQIGDVMEVLERPQPDWSVRKLTRARFDKNIDPAIAKELAENNLLAAPWKASFLKKADKAFVEDTSKRLDG
ncbi:MOSC domain-containing protein [Terasakiella sp. A23]|uniref:MOSC domain-containing protein n=1 Tax=Terasakiella sp. FCG-A23 TaxID=3080561 RepID=UPI002953FF05|nr:MOSC domain-containing protein [Terasakiella sp. A23]MDV7338196.1 MOSC domain-containing protein [Terasakiella sp. A23]